MRCPNCGTEIPEGSLYCEKCGEDIHIVPDYDTKIDLNMDSALQNIGDQIKEDYPGDHPVKRDASHRGEAEEATRGARVRFYALVGALACLAVLTIVMVCVTQISMKRDLSPEYQLDMAVKYRERGEYGRAIECYSRVMELRGEDAEILALLSDLYYLQNDSANYELTLRRILFSKNATQEQLHLAKDKLVILLIKKGDFDGINQMLMSEEDSELSEKYSMYLAPEPILDLKEGAYEGIQSLRISCAGKGKIYYTLDGTIPGENSAEYTLPVILDYGDVVVKACMINEYGVKSKIVQANYQIQRPLEIPQ